MKLPTPPPFPNPYAHLEKRAENSKRTTSKMTRDEAGDKNSSPTAQAGSEIVESTVNHQSSQAKARGGTNVSQPAKAGDGIAGSIDYLHSTRANASGGNVSPPAQSGEGTAAESIGSPQSTNEWRCNNKAMRQELQQSQDLQTFHHWQRLTLVRKVHDKGSVYIAQTAFSLLCV